MSDNNERYDRQIRLWGPHGQAAIQSATILFLGSDCVASEFLKNMVLHGVNNIYIVDNVITTNEDLGTNFFVNEESLGKSRAEIISVLLTELNPSSKIKAIEADPNDLNSFDDISSHLEGQECYVVTSGNLRPSFLNALSDRCRQKGFKQAHIQTSGFLGTFYLDGGLHYFFEGSSQSKYPLKELRILNPFPKLAEFWESIDFDGIDDIEHAHIVFPAILYKVRKEVLSELNIKELSSKNEFAIRDKINSLRRKKKNPSPEEDPFMQEAGFDEAQDNISLLYGKPSIPIEVSDYFQLLQDNDSIYKEGEGILFWELMFATLRFYEKHKVLPHYGGCPDMEATSDLFRKQKNIYKEKSDEDWAEISEDLKSRGIDTDSNKEIFERFKKNVWRAGGVVYQPIKEQITKLPNQNFLYDDESIKLAIVQDLFIAARNFYEKNNRVPINTTEDVQNLLKEMEDLKEIINEDIKEQFIKERELYVKEFCRYKGEAFPSVAATFAAMLAQEVTKLIIKQANPVPGIVNYDSIHAYLNVSS